MLLMSKLLSQSQHNFSHLFMTTDTKLYVISIKMLVLTHNLPEIICLYYRGTAKIFSPDRALHHLPLYNVKSLSVCNVDH